MKTFLENECGNLKPHALSTDRTLCIKEKCGRVGIKKNMISQTENVFIGPLCSGTFTGTGTLHLFAREVSSEEHYEARSLLDEISK